MSKIKFWLIWGTGYLGLWELRTNESAITAFSSYCLFCCHLSSMSSKSPARGIPLHRASPLNWLLKDYGYSSWRSGVEMAGMPRWWFLPLKVMTRRATVLSGLLWILLSKDVLVSCWADPRNLTSFCISCTLLTSVSSCQLIGVKSCLEIWECLNISFSLLYFVLKEVFGCIKGFQ